MKRWTKIALVAGLVVAGASSVAWAGRGGGHRGMMRWFASHRLGAALDYIDATPAQRQLVEGIKDDLFDKMKAKKAANRELGPQIAALLAADQLDTAKLTAIADAKVEEARALSRDLIQDIARIHASLTPAQRQKLLARWQELQAKRKARHQAPQGGFGGSD